MVDFNKLISTVTSSGVGSGLAGGLAGGALVGALTTKSGRKAAVSVAKVGGLAAVGALAWTAYKNYQGNSAPQSVESAPSAVQPGSAWQGLPQQNFDALAAPNQASQGLLVLRTMIAAAMADGHLGEQEQQHIFGKLDGLGLTGEERGMLFDELRQPQTAAALAAGVSDPVMAIEVYTAARMTVATDCQSSQAFLGDLAAALKLPDSLRASIHSSARSTFAATA